MVSGDPWHGWIPLYVKGACAEVEWAYIGDKRFSDPFCHDTLHRLAARPFNQMFRRKSGLDLLLEREHSHPGLPLRGIIFHMSRCGSTLAAQWLAALPDSVVLSEPEALGVMLQWSLPDADEGLLRGLLAAMGQARRASDSRLFLKTNCMQMLTIDRLLTALPGTPWVFMYRDPVEVLVSHQSKPIWMHMQEALPGCGLQPPAGFGDDPEEGAAWMLSVVLQQARQAMLRYDNGLLLNYSELPQALETMSVHFGVAMESLDAEALNAVMGRNAKQRHEVYLPDTAEKRAAANAHITELAARWLDEPYQLLEQRRLGRVVAL